jgi:hypothetical protein
MKLKEFKQAMDWRRRVGFNGGGYVKKKVLPQPKPKEEAEKVNKARKEKTFEKAKPALENPKEVKEMIDKPKRGLVDEPGSYSGKVKTVKALAEKGIGLLDGKTLAQAKKIVQDAYKLLKSKKVQKKTDIPLKGTVGSTDDLRYMKKVGRETKVRPGVEYEGDTKFFQLFNDFKDGFYGGQVKAAANNLNVGGASKEANRIRIRKAFKNYNQPLVSGKGGKKDLRTTVDAPDPKQTISLQQAKIKVKKGEDYFNDIELPEGVELNKFYTTDDITNILKLNAKDRANVAKDLNAFFKQAGIRDKDKIKIGDVPQFKLSSAIKVLTESGQRTTKQKGLGDTSSVKRIKTEMEIDPEYVRFFGALNQRARNLQQESDVYFASKGMGTMESRGHAVDLNIAKKYPKLFKNSNANKPSSLVYQDPLVNEKIFQSLGFGSKPEKDFKILESFVGKKVTPKMQAQLKIIKQNFENNYFNQVQTISNPQRSKQILINAAKNYAKSRLQKGKKTAAEAREIVNNAKNIDMNYLNTFLKNQQNRVQKLDVKIPKAGETFKSENFFADMSVIDPDYVVGKMTTINPKAKTLGDLSKKEMDIYQDNVVNQYEDYLTGYYQTIKDKAGNRIYSNEDIADMTDYLRFGTGGGKGKNAPGMLQGMEEPYVPKNPADRKTFSEGDLVTSKDTDFENFLKLGAGASTGAAAVGTKRGRNILGKIFRGAGTPLAGLGFAGTNVISKMKEGQSLADAVVDPLTGLELSFPGLFKENLKKIIPERFQGRAARFGRGLLGLRGIPVGPIGLTLAGLGQAQEFYNQYQNLQRMKKQNPKAYSDFISRRVAPALSAAEQTAIENMGRSGAAGGGIMKMAGKSSGPPPESGPTPQGLDFLLKRGR